MELHEALAAKDDAWRAAGYPSDVPALAEILDFAVEDVEAGAPRPRSGRVRYLRAAQPARRHDEVEGELGVKARAMAALQAANPGRTFYRMVFADAVAPTPDIAAVREFVEEAAG